MIGTHRVIIQSKKVRYDFEIKHMTYDNIRYSTEVTWYYTELVPEIT